MNKKMDKFEFVTYCEQTREEKILKFEDSFCNGIPKGRRLLKRAFGSNVDCAEFWLVGRPDEIGDGRRSILVFAFDKTSRNKVDYFAHQKWYTKNLLLET